MAQERVVLVTGAAQGLGKAIALHFGKLGDTVVVNDIANLDQAEQVVEAIRAKGAQSIFVQADITDPAQVRRMFDTIIQAFKTIHVVVNNAGIRQDAPTTDLAPEVWSRQIAVNLSGAHFVSQAALPYMIKQGFGRIINMSSISAQIGAPKGVAYGASKAGLIGYTRSLAKELAETGITVNAVAPGTIETDMVLSMPPDIQAQWKSEIPMKRCGTPEEVASLVAFISSNKACFITGQTINLNGGQYVSG